MVILEHVRFNAQDGMSDGIMVFLPSRVAKRRNWDDK
jgi:hypothetical protein